MNRPTLVEPARGLLRIRGRKLPRWIEVAFCRIYQEFPTKEINGNSVEDAAQLIVWSLRALIHPDVLRLVQADADIRREFVECKALLNQLCPD